ncbi:MAG: 5-(carboxyamino)imidazole ribonucleotide mutase [bacterium JZ-2024 1]
MKAVKQKVGVIVASLKEREKISGGLKILEECKIGYRVAVASAHRSPRYVEEIVEQWGDVGVWIAVAGKAAHLAGSLAARSPMPVIGVPMGDSVPDGLDALLSTVQMPKGIPVATVGVGEFENACYLAVRILSLTEPELKKRVQKWMEEWEREYRKVPIIEVE